MESLARISVTRNFRRFTVGVALTAAFAVAGCGPKKPTAAVVASAYDTPEQAGQALLSASKSGDANALKQILGPDSQPIYSSGDANEDKADLASFVDKYNRMNRWVALNDGSRVLYIGADNYPFPVHLKKSADGRWMFDAQSGLDEIVTRRIGKNELLAIDAVSAVANAEELYFKKPHDGNPAGRYAQLVISSSGKQDGLYWPSPDGKDLSPLGKVEDFASDAIAAAASGQQPVFDGYYIRILTAQGDKVKGGAKSYLVNGKLTGGFAVLAYPAKYQDSGIMTFQLSREGVVYQKNLGANTTQAAAAIDSYNPDDTWAEAE